MDKPLKSVTHGQCDRDARPTVILPIAGHPCLATGIKLYCLVTEAHVCEQLAQGSYLTAARLGVELETSRVTNHALTITPPPNYKIIQVLLFCVYSTGSRAGLTQYK